MKLSKTYLESVAVDELLRLAEIYGLYVPKGLNRNFIIEELLELEEYGEDEISPHTGNRKKKFYEEEPDDDPKKVKLFKGLPSSYNSTEIRILLRDPMWLFVFWDFYRPSFKTITEDMQFDSFILRVMLFYENNRSEPYDYYDIDISKEDTGRYIFLSFDDVLTRVNLCVRFSDETVKVLAESNFIHLNRKNIPNALCLLENNVNTVSALSGISILKKSHFKNYRQAFRDNKDEEEKSEK